MLKAAVIRFELINQSFPQSSPLMAPISKALLLGTLWCLQSVIAQSAANGNNSSVLGVVIFSRHGGRTTKLYPPTLLTNLGANEVFQSGNYYRSRYINNGSSNQIAGFSAIYDSKQLYAAVPDTGSESGLLLQSATGLLQGLYPPVLSDPMTSEVFALANGSQVIAPLNGYQYVVVNSIDANSPNSIWLAGGSKCPTFAKASVNYMNSTEFMSLKASTQTFYNSFAGLLSGVLPENALGYQNAYTIFDYLNVNYIHNQTVKNNLTAEDLLQLRTLADKHELGLNFNASVPATTIGAQTFLSAIQTQLLNVKNGTSKSAVYFGAYHTFLSFFGLANLTTVNENFTGLPDYAATMAFELRNSSTGDISVRFLYKNGSDPNVETQAYPLFGSSSVDMSWDVFNNNVQKLAIQSQSDWCKTCGSTAAFCKSSSSSASSESSAASCSNNGSGGLSNAAAGAIGFGVTTGAYLILGALLFFLLRRRLGRQSGHSRDATSVASDKATIDRH